MGSVNNLPRPSSRAQFFNDPSDVTWLRATHLKHLPHKEFNSFILFGNEDCPDKIYLYSTFDPLCTTAPVEIINLLELEVAA